MDLSLTGRGGGSFPFWLLWPFLLVGGKVLLMQRGWGQGIFYFLFPQGTKIYICKDYLLLALISIPAAAFFSYANAVSSELGAGLCRAGSAWVLGTWTLPEVPQLCPGGRLGFPDAGASCRRT